MLKGLRLSAAIEQQDRRWRNLCYYDEQNKAAGHPSPQTGAQHQQRLIDFGMQPRKPLDSTQADKLMDFGQFMQACSL
jgi:hypothetical protein